MKAHVVIEIEAGQVMSCYSAPGLNVVLVDYDCDLPHITPKASLRSPKVPSASLLNNTEGTVCVEERLARLSGQLLQLIEDAMPVEQD